ncbi:stress response protein NST1 [Brachypodium distachyon]|uniref:Uncharacterized protein n=1 Tax=Brachypodium distachyon TaxID=15368 RepID=I1HAK4_BRADI|nr:stress response protein NST1 [Brachypodium distachyon]KQK24022.1 hypothetical protein BRADI_1g77630v3 [Brachypodium distachyon]|eukprot:XP_010229311.1 stress response protein NST1 [Brachypodium distachyon]
MSQGTSPLPKDKGPAEDSLKAVGTKRLHSDAPSSPVYQNVYVRRKVDTEHNKVNSSQELRSNGRDKTKEQEEQQNLETEHSKVNSPQELKGNVRQQEELQNVGIEHSKVIASQELKGNGGDKIKVSSSQEFKGNEREQEEHKNVEIEHNKVNSSQELRGDGGDKIKVVSSQEFKGNEREQEEQKNVEIEHSKVNSSQELKSNGLDKIEVKEEQQMVQHDQINEPEVASPIVESGGQVSSEMTSPIGESGELVPPESPSKTIAETVPKNNELPIPSANELPVPSANELPVPSANELPVPSANEPAITPDTLVQGDAHRPSNQNAYWSERYNRLQTYLENCNQSSQEGYMQMLRSLSAAGRSMHAIELEKRAIHLLVEEGKELQRMKALNVLGKNSPNGSSKQPPLQR